ncbi:unnamed protein product [Strongylus vulgaris]|uniref:Uncharacterized protein n=1 Tax=Strongylus vulgaris TaxID=40348 RepID=A0A3P7L7A7_STRVU|nr:unnamed protein product [Strongylus vulgaris]
MEGVTLLILTAIIYLVSGKCHYNYSSFFEGFVDGAPKDLVQRVEDFLKVKLVCSQLIVLKAKVVVLGLL